jgi:hypothetical protein
MVAPFNQILLLMWKIRVQVMYVCMYVSHSWPYFTVSSVKYGIELYGTLTQSDCSGKAQKQLYSKLQIPPLIREGATKYKPATI